VKGPYYEEKKVRSFKKKSPRALSKTGGKEGVWVEHRNKRQRRENISEGRRIKKEGDSAGEGKPFQRQKPKQHTKKETLEGEGRGRGVDQKRCKMTRCGKVSTMLLGTACSCKIRGKGNKGGAHYGEGIKDVGQGGGAKGEKGSKKGIFTKRGSKPRVWGIGSCNASISAIS